MGPGPLLLGERPRLGRVPHRAGHADHADVVDRPGPRAGSRRRRRTSPASRAASPTSSATPREWPMRNGDLRSAKSPSAYSAASSCSSVSCCAQPGIELDHLVPGLERAEPVEDRVGSRAEAVDEIGVELRAAAARGDLDRGVDAAACGGRPRCCRRDGRAESPAPARSWPTRPGTPLPSHRSKAWMSGARTVVAELEPAGELAGGLAVRLHHLLHRAAGRGQELADHADPTQP